LLRRHPVAGERLAPVSRSSPSDEIQQLAGAIAAMIGRSHDQLGMS